MWRASTDTAPDGARLAFPAFNSGNQPLAEPGAPLTPALREQLAGASYREVVLLEPAEDPAPPGVAAERQAALTALDHARKHFLRALALDAPTPTAAAGRAEDALAAALAPLAERQRSARRVWLPGPHRTLEPLRWLDEALEGVDAATFVGAKLGLDDDTLHALAHGMALRDVGLLAVPPEPLQRRGALTDDERRTVQAHAAIGFGLLQDLDWGDGSVRLVVQQHHERQDGSGYPAGVRGVHRVHRRAGERFNRDLMINLAEIAGVCDTFVALNAHRPHRRRLSPSRVRAELHQLGDGPLSAEAVDILLAMWSPPSAEEATPAAGAAQPPHAAHAKQAPPTPADAGLIDLIGRWRAPHDPRTPDTRLHGERLGLLVGGARDQQAPRRAAG